MQKDKGIKNDTGIEENCWTKSFITGVDKIKGRSQEELSLLQNIIEHNPYAIAGYDAEGHFTGCNKAFIKMFKTTPPENYSIFDDPIVKKNGLIPKLRESIKNGSVVKVPEFWYNPHELSPGLPDVSVYFRTVVFPIKDENGKLKNVILMFEDITEQKKAEQAIKKVHENFASVMNEMDSLVYVSDMNTYELLFINSYGRKIWGDHVGKPCWSVLQEGQKGPCAFCTNDKLLDTNGGPAGVYVWEFQNTKDHQWYECRDQAIEWPDGRLVRMQAATNITFRKQAQDKIIIERNRAELFLDLLGHDVTNINQGILISAELLDRKNDLTEDTKKYILNIIQQSNRISKLVRNVRKLSEIKSDEIHIEDIDVQDVIENSLKRIYEENTGRNLRVNHDLSGNKVIARGSNDIQDLFVNIINNALKFDKSKNVIIDIVHSLSGDGKFWKIEFKDHGPGVPDEMKSKIFKHFEFGPEKTSRSGLGLLLAAEIVNNLGGRIWVEDRIEGNHSKGSNFVVLLPRGKTDKALEKQL